MERRQPGPDNSSRTLHARSSAISAYADARRDVYDQFPQGIDVDLLTDEQKASLARLDKAEHELDDSRRASFDEIDARRHQD